MTSNGIDFIDEDNAGGVLFSLFEQIAHARSADSNKHLHEVRTTDGEEGHVRFARDCSRQQCLSSTRRTDKKYSLWNTPTEFLELLGFLQKVDDLLQFFLCLFNTGDIFES